MLSKHACPFGLHGQGATKQLVQPRCFGAACMPRLVTPSQQDYFPHQQNCLWSAHQHHSAYSAHHRHISDALPGRSSASASGLGGPVATGSLTSSLQLAWCRAQETLQEAAPQQQATSSTGSASLQVAETQPTLVSDPYAHSLLSLGKQAAHTCDPLLQLINSLTTRYIDDTLLMAMAATNVNTINKGDYRQVVLVGDGLDTRPFRLPWPEGTLLFLVAPRSDHEAAVPLLKAAGAHVPRGCLLRRVAADLVEPDDTGGLLQRLEAAGFQASRLSVWALQGLASQCLSSSAVRQLLTDLTNAAAFNSLVLGELPTADMDNQEAQNLLAENGLLSTVLPLDSPAVSQGLWTLDHTQQLASRGQQRWLFTGQVLRLSLAQMGLYDAHVTAQEADEDYFDNIS